MPDANDAIHFGSLLNHFKNIIMKKILFSVAPVFLLFGFWFFENSEIESCRACAPISNYGTEITGIMAQMKVYTLAIANQMPADKYDFKPVDDDTVRTFGEQFKHIIISLKGQTEDILEGKSFNVKNRIRELEEYEELKMTKEEIITSLSAACDKLIHKLSSMSKKDFDKTYQLPFSKSGPISYRMVTMFIRDHITHHRAQAIVYLRMNGIEPTFYVPF